MQKEMKRGEGKAEGNEEGEGENKVVTGFGEGWKRLERFLGG